jgi:hypothetical protein
MSYFRKELSRRQVNEGGRRWLFVPYDQLTDQIDPLSREDPRSLGIVFVESPWKAARRPYHKQKLALIIANLRQLDLEQADRGVAVRQVIAEGSYATALEPVIPKLGPLRVMAPAEGESGMDGMTGAIIILRLFSFQEDCGSRLHTAEMVEGVDPGGETKRKKRSGML